MQSTTPTTTHRTGAVAAALVRRWPALALGICALLALAILAIGAVPAGAAPAGQISNRSSRQRSRNSGSAGEQPVGYRRGDPIPAATDSERRRHYHTLDGMTKKFKIRIQ